MDQDRQRLAVPLDHRRRPARPWLGYSDRAPGGIDEGSCFRQPVADLQARVAQRPRELVAQAAGAGLAEFHDQIGHLGALPRPAHQADEQASRQSAQHHLIGQQARRIRGRPGHGGAGQRDRGGTGREQRRGLQGRAAHPAFASRGVQVPADRDRDENGGQRHGAHLAIPDRCHDRGRIARGNRGALHTPMNTPPRIGENQLHQRAPMQVQHTRAQPAQQAHAGRRDARHEPGETRGRQQRTGPALRAARPPGQPAPDQAPAGYQVGHPAAQVRPAVQPPFRRDAHRHPGRPAQQPRPVAGRCSRPARPAQHPTAPASPGTRTPAPLPHAARRRPHRGWRSAPPAAGPGQPPVARPPRTRPHREAGYPAAPHPAAAAPPPPPRRHHPRHPRPR